MRVGTQRRAAACQVCKREGICRPARGGIGNGAGRAAALCKLRSGKLRWRVCHNSKTRGGRLQASSSAAAVSRRSRLSKQRPERAPDRLSSRLKTSNPGHRPIRSPAACPCRGSVSTVAPAASACRTSPVPSSRRACRMPERGTTGTVNRQPVLIRGRGREWQRSNWAMSRSEDIPTKDCYRSVILRPARGLGALRAAPRGMQPPQARDGNVNRTAANSGASYLARATWAEVDCSVPGSLGH